MKLLVIAFNHYDNIFAYTSALCAYTDIDVTVLLVGYGDRFATSSFEADLRTYDYGMNRNVRQNLFPQELDESLNSKLNIHLLRLAPQKVRVRNLIKNWIYCYLAALRLKNRFDVIHFNGVGLTAIFLSTFFSKAKKVLTIHDYKSHSGEGGKISSALNRKLVRRFEHYIQHYDWLSDAFSEYYKVDRAKVFTVRSGTFDHFKAFAPVLPQQSGYMLFFGRISPYKGLKHLVKAYAKGSKMHKFQDLVIAGSGDASDILGMTNDLPQIHLINKRLSINELVGLVQRADYVICPYTDATHSAVTVVAYTFGKPVLAHNVGGLSEVIIDGKTGILIDNLESETICKGILRMNEMIEKEDVDASISEHTVSGSISWKSIAEVYRGVYLAVNGQ